MTATSKFKRRPRVRLKSGAPPGTLFVDPDARKPTIRVFCYSRDVLIEREIDRLEELSKLHSDETTVTWVNVDGLGDLPTLEAIGSIFGLHQLALEDVAHVTQRPKIEAYDDHYYIVVRMPEPNRHLETEQISIFLGKDYVLTFQERPGDCFEAVRKRLRDGRPTIRSSGPDYLVYAILDAVVDAYFPVMEELEAKLDRFEAEILAGAGEETLGDLHALKRDLLTLHRVVLQLREALRLLLREETPLIQRATQTYLRDCYDHAVQLFDLVTSDQEAAAGLMEYYQSIVSNRMNEIMKVLTIMASIFIPLTFVVGIYGMNFDFMPELRYRWAYPALMTLLLLVALGMVAFFRHRRWLGARRGKR